MVGEGRAVRLASFASMLSALRLQARKMMMRV